MGPKFKATLWIPKILDQIAFSVATWKFYRDRVFNLHRRFLLQHAVVYHDLFPMLLLRFHRDRVSLVAIVVCRDLFHVLFPGFRRDRFSLVVTVFFSSAYSFCHDRSFFGSLIICLAKSVVLTVLCRDNFMCGSFNSYVATSTILLRPSFFEASSNWCREPVFISRQHFCFGSCCNIVSCIVKISIAT